MNHPHQSVPHPTHNINEIPITKKKKYFNNQPHLIENDSDIHKHTTTKKHSTHTHGWHNHKKRRNNSTFDSLNIHFHDSGMN